MSAEDLNRENARLNYEAMTADAMKRIEYQVAFAENALKGLMLVNGGAIVALFTFIGNTGSLAPDTNKLWWAFGSFAGGLVFTLIAYFGACLSQGYFYQTSQAEAWNFQSRMVEGRWGTNDHIGPFNRGLRAEAAGTVSAALALLAFLAGAIFALLGVMPA